MKKSVYNFIKRVDSVAYEIFKQVTKRHKQKYCCYMMRIDLEKNCNSDDRFSSSDCLIYKSDDNHYGIINGIKSYVVIKYCPWCGRCLE